MALGKLNTLKIKGLVAPGRYGDGGGLWLQVRSPENRSWMFRFTLHGRPRWMGLGPAHDLTLAEARDRARDCRKLLLDGIDPVERRKAARQTARETTQSETFRQVAELYIAAHADTWKNPKHAAQWPATFKTYVYPVFGNRPVSGVSTADVMRVLEPIWRTKPETASRVRGRIEAVIDYATARGWRTGDNPSRWRGHIENLLPARNKVQRVEHHAALPWAEMGAFMEELRPARGVAALALRFTILTAARTGEVIGADWSEIDPAEKLWTIPASRMKAGREHRVPLSPDALAILAELQMLRGTQLRPRGAAAVKAADWIFPGGKSGKPLSNAAMAAVLDRLGRDDLTVHGFRSSFRDWVSESTAYPRELAETALAHTLKDKVEAAYRRGDVLQKRRRLMDEWATYCNKPASVRTAVVSIGEASHVG